MKEFRKHSWKVNLLSGDDHYQFKEQLNSPHAYSIITVFNVNWERFSATFSHLLNRTVVLGRLSGKTGQPFILSGNTFSFLTNHNGTDVLRFPARLTRTRS